MSKNDAPKSSNSLEWLQRVYGTERATGKPITCLQRLASLFARNGFSFETRMYNKITEDIKHPYGFVGIGVPEVIELQYLHGVLEGLGMAEGYRNTSAVQELMRLEVERVSKEISTPKSKLIIPR